MTDLFSPLTFARGAEMKNRFMLAPMTNQQSHHDGRLSDDEFDWLIKRASGGFGLVMTAAAHVQPVGQGFPRQLGVFGEQHTHGLSRLAEAIRANGALSAVQLHHAGYRAPTELVGTPVGPSDNSETRSRGLNLDEVIQLREDFIAAAVRVDEAGFDGVQIHGAHGYILADFLSPSVNLRRDRYGGSLENRTRLLFEIIDGIRSACNSDFQIGLRLSPERYAQDLLEVREVAAKVLQAGVIDYLDLSLWDVTKEPEDERFKGRTLLSLFTELPRGKVRLGAAGKVMSGPDANLVIESGCDFASIGRAAILRHNFPERVRKEASFESPNLPVSKAHLVSEAIGANFREYLQTWPGFVADEQG